MLYWEDYIEMIEHLPQELKDRFTGIRELDLQVQNATDKLEEKVKDFFGGARKLRPTEREEVYETMKKDYFKVLEDADEKVHQANQMYDLVERYIRRLDQDLYKFKMELEADNAGITEILEKRSLELDLTGSKDSKEKDLNPNSQKENRLLPQTPLAGIKVERRGRKRLMNGKVKGGESGTATPTTSYNGEPLDLAASHLVAALAHSIQKGKGNGVNGQGYEFYDHDSSLNGIPLDMMDPLAVAELKRKKTDGFARFSMNGSDDGGVNGIKKNKRKSQHIKTEEDGDPNGQDLENGNGDQPEIWPYDPSEPRYCLCNQVSYGNMVACDNENCTIEWFHYDCVGITASPKGKWYCPQCLPTVKRRGRKTLNPQP